MAILKEHQALGLGRKLLNYGETILTSKKVRLIWCNARENACDFYKTCNYFVTGNAFNIPNVGIHYIMYKQFQ